MTQPDSPRADTSDGGVNLRLLWLQWQGAGTASVEAFASEFPLEVARRGYAVGTAVLEAVLPPHDGPTATAPVTMSGEGIEERDGVEAKAVVLDQLASAFEVIRRHDPARITTFGGECSVSVAPFSELARRYGDDLAVVWIDAHPDIGTPRSEYPGYHAMAVAALTGHGDPDVQELLPATVSPDRVALVGLHSWTDDDFPNVAEWGIQSFSPGELRATTHPVLDWLKATGCSRVAIHFDVDVIDSDEVVLGLGAEPNGLTSTEVRRIVADIDKAADVVGFTIAEFIPRQVMHLRQTLQGFPLIS
ncbi:arginase family protein [Saccharopolyspora erythraea]|uniref:arginase family protein n=1 Tax=Saccharopolyspora erythraea TaxID=1836 RepID=UPI001BA97C0F|nr:arginase family protein [Saccharopolyspora erythraea]QUH03816.1 arginase family protein [Saccharopolyspora erythraea]